MAISDNEWPTKLGEYWAEMKRRRTEANEAGEMELAEHYRAAQKAAKKGALMLSLAHREPAHSMQFQALVSEAVRRGSMVDYPKE